MFLHQLCRHKWYLVASRGDNTVDNFANRTKVTVTTNCCTELISFIFQLGSCKLLRSFELPLLLFPFMAMRVAQALCSALQRALLQSKGSHEVRYSCRCEQRSFTCMGTECWFSTPSHCQVYFAGIYKRVHFDTFCLVK